MRPLKERFKTFGGDFITDIVEYLTNYISNNPEVTISVGCDSVQKKRKTLYAVTLMMYNQDYRNGAHIVFFRQNLPRVKDNFERLHKEVLLVQEVAEFIEQELSDIYIRKDLSSIERKKYKFHINKCNGEYINLPNMQEDSFIKNIELTDGEKNQDYKLIDIHLDFNPNEGGVDFRGYHKNKSFVCYKSFVPWLRGMGYRVWAKPNAYAASSAADLLLQD